MSPGKSIEEWEAADIISDLKCGLARPGEQPRSGVCSYHDSMTRALIWIVRRMDNNPQRESSAAPFEGGVGPWKFKLSDGRLLDRVTLLVLAVGLIYVILKGGVI